jgi:hypothetical protein
MVADALFRFPAAVTRDPAVAEWMDEQPDDLRSIASRWFEVMRACGDDVREVLHDGHPTACVGDAAFAYVDAFTAHVNVGFYRGSGLPDPHGLLEGVGRRMRHVKIRTADGVNADALTRLIESACDEVRRLVARRAADPHD